MSVSKRADTGRWQARYRGPDGRQRAKDFDTKRDATAWDQEQRRAVQRSEWTDPDAARMTVGEMYPKWLDSLTIKPTTRHDYQGLWSTCVARTWQDSPLSRVTPLGVRTWLAQLTGVKEQPLSASRKRNAFLVLSAILEAAVRDGRLIRNPATVGGAGGRGGFLPRVESSVTRRYLTFAELKALAKATGVYESLILVLGCCGLRWGEIVALRVQDVDLLRNRLHVDRSAANVNGEIIYGPTKTHQIREVPVPTFLRNPLLAQMQGKEPTDLLFTSPEGGPLRSQNFGRRVFTPALVKAGLERMRVHDLRHTTAALAVDAGANIKGIQRMLGHADASMTLNTYADLFDGHLDEVAERLHAAYLEADVHSVRTGLAEVTSIRAGLEG
jgi:integrase